MLYKAPPCEVVMTQFADFIAGHALVAHNAAFDRRFLAAELRRIHKPCAGEFACSMLLARRVYPEAPNHKLGTLVEFNSLPNNGTFHRALADAEMTAHLWLAMLGRISERHRVGQVPFALMRDLARVPKGSIQKFIDNWQIERDVG